jgi:hypothetical protein
MGITDSGEDSEVRFREALAIKRERLRAKRAAKQRST